MLNQSLTSKRFISLSVYVSLVTIGSMFSACTLDFDEFEPYTDPSAYAGNEVQQPDMNADMIVQADLNMADMILVDQIIMVVGDTDEDGINDDVDNCIEVANPLQGDGDGDGKGDACDDDDADGVLDYITQENGDSVVFDNCLNLANPDQKDIDLDKQGDLCDEDIDGDTLLNQEEETAGLNAQKADSDYDGFRDDIDLCPLVMSRLNIDSDGDGLGNACDNDDDGDGVLDWADVCPYTSDPEQSIEEGRGVACLDDFDADGISDQEDTCPFEPADINGKQLCELAVQRMGFDGNVKDVYASKADGFTDLWYASAGGLYTRDLPINFYRDEDQRIKSWGEENSLWSRNTYKIQPISEPYSWWVLTDRGLSSVHWDSRLEQYYIRNLSVAAAEIKGDVTDIVNADGQYVVSSTQGLYHITSTEVLEIPVGTINEPEINFLEKGLSGIVWFSIDTTLYFYDVNNPEQGCVTYVSFLELGKIRNLYMGVNEESYWIISDQYTQFMNRDNPVPIISLEQNSYDALSQENGHYLADADGMIWIDSYDRVYAGIDKQINRSKVNEIHRKTALNSDLWIGTQEGVLQVDDLWIGEQFPDTVCVNDSYPINSDWWFIAQEGILKKNIQGVIENVYNGNFYKTEYYNSELWAIGETGLVKVDANSTVTPYPIANFNPPYTAIEIFENQIWIGNDQGVAYATITDGVPTQWSFLLAADEDYLYPGVVNDIEYYNGSVWVAVSARENQEDAEGGVSEYILANGNFNNLVYRQNNGIIPSNHIYALSITATRTMIATRSGTLVFTGDLTNRNVLKINTGLPPEVGDSHVTSIVDLDDIIWLTLSQGSELENGGLISIETQSNDYIMNANRTRLFTYDNNDALMSSDIQKLSLRAHRNEAGTKLTLHVCGSMNSSGGVGLLNSRYSTKRHLKAKALVGTGNGQRLIPASKDPFVAYITQVEKIDGSTYSYMRDLYTPLQTEDENIVPPQALKLAPEFDAPVVRCRDYRLQNEISKRIRCLLSNGYFVYFDNNQWYRDEMPILDPMITTYDIVLDPNNIANQTWVASNQGLIAIRNQQVSEYNVENTMNAFPSNQVNTLAYNSIDKRLYIGTDQGMVSLDLGIPLPNDVSMIQWQSYPELAQRHINAFSINQTSGEVWIATDVSIAVLRQGTITEYGVQDGLVGLPVRDLVIDGNLNVWLLHGSGLSKYDGTTWSHYGPRVGFDYSASQLMLDQSGQLWVLSDQGVSMLPVGVEQ